MERKRTAGGAKSGGTDWAAGPQQPAAAQQSGDSFLRPTLRPSEWASLEVAAPPLTLTPPGTGRTLSPPRVGGRRRWAGLTTGGCWGQTLQSAFHKAHRF